MKKYYSAVLPFCNSVIVVVYPNGMLLKNDYSVLFLLLGIET